MVPVGFYPWIYVRNFFGLVFVLFLPGYSFVKAFLNQNSTKEKMLGDIETIERIALISLVGILLYYSPLGLSIETIVITIFAMTCIFGVVATIKGK